MQSIPVGQTISMVLSVIGVVVAVVLLIIGTAGRSRVAGVIGSALMVLGTLSGFAYGRVIRPIVGQVSEDTLISILALQTVIGSVLTGLGVLLLTYAIVAAHRPPNL